MLSLSGLLLSSACANRADISDQVRSHDVPAMQASTAASRSGESGSSRAACTAAMKASASLATLTRPRPAKGVTTSAIGVDTTRLPPARYSSVFVGLMKRVDSLSANGISATSQPARYRGSSAYGLGPR